MKKKDETEEYEDDTEKKWKEISKYLEGKSYLEIYLKSSSIVTDNEIINFRIKRIRIKTGMNLLPLYDKNLDEKQRKEIYELYHDANSKLKSCFPQKRKAKFSFEDLGDTVYDVYKISSTDIGEYHARPHDISVIIEDFKRQQFEFHSQELEETDNIIQQMLMKYEIIPKSSPDLEIDKAISNMLQDLFKKQVQSLIKEQEKNAE